MKFYFRKYFSTHLVELLTIISMCKFRVLVLESFIVQATLKYSYTAYVYAPEIKVQKDVFVNRTHLQSL